MASPTLNAEEMKDSKTERRTGPGGVGEPDTFEAYQARQCARGGGSEEGLDLREVGGCSRSAGEFEIGLENGIGEIEMAEGFRSAVVIVGIRIRVRGGPPMVVG